MYEDLNELNVGFLKYFCTFFFSSFLKIKFKKHSSFIAFPGGESGNQNRGGRNGMVMTFTTSEDAKKTRRSQAKIEYEKNTIANVFNRIN
jgi:hypothetical protein